jgi:acyl-CoA reductase-like NAD-dependent aldehyde dehydrogenase
VKYRSLDYAIERANATNFGLSDSVWGTDVERASAVASELECGTTWINTNLGLAPSQPFGGCKWSDMGVENGKSGLSEFTEVQSVYQSRTRDGTNPSWPSSSGSGRSSTSAW